MKGKNKILSLLLRYGMPLLISVGLCYVLFSKVNFRDNIAIVSSYCNFWWIGLALVLSIFSHIIRALRWRIQLRALDVNAPLINVVFSIFGTYAVNLVLPRLGEIWRTGYIANRQKVSFTKVFGSMVSDRLVDMITVFLIMLLTFVVASGTLTDYIESEPGRLERITGLLTSGWVWTAAGIVIVGAWLVFTRMPQNRAVAKIKEMALSMWRGFAVIIHMKGLGMWVVYTVMLWGCYFVQLYVAFFSFDFTTQILARYGIAAPLVCFLLSTIALILPSNGGYGPWQMAVIFGLGFYSTGITVPAGKTFLEMSVAFANCVMTTETILLILLGLFTFTAIALEKRRAR